MRTMIAVSLAAVLAMGMFVAGCQEQPKSVAPVVKGADAKAAGQAEIAQKVCPVMGGKIDPNIYVDYNGRRVYFCCNMCPPKFKEDPDKYLKKLDEQLKAAPPAESAPAERK